MENKKEPKQCIVVRGDLRNQKGEKIRTGKIVAQACHASLGVVLDMFLRERYGGLCGNDPCRITRLSLEVENGSDLDKWLNGLFTKICVKCNSEAELDAIYLMAEERGIPCKMIVDAGLTEFGGVPTKTAVAIGPDWEDKINEVTGHLKLL